MTALQFERWYPHAPERVWRALTDRELLARWLMPNDFEPRVGHQFTFRTEPGPGFDGIVSCEVLEIDPPTNLAFTWRGGPIDTVVRFTLVREGEGTRLRMEQTGFRGLKAWLVSRILKAGLPSIYGKRLPRVLEELEGPRGGASSRPPSNACMTYRQGLVRRLLAWMPRKKR